MTVFTLSDLADIIERRADADAERSYTRSLLDGGRERTAKKFGEEAVEAVIAVIVGDKNAVTMEAADVVYHLLVMLKASGVTVADVLAELERRTAQSGVDEKASRRAASGRSADG
jgi:phosphoribosyl-ATP pyrophosphohydrolase